MPVYEPSSQTSPYGLTQEIPEREHSLSNSLGQDISYDADRLEGSASTDETPPATQPDSRTPPRDEPGEDVEGGEKDVEPDVDETDAD